MKISNGMQLSLGAMAAVGIAVGVVAFIGPAPMAVTPAPAPVGVNAPAQAVVTAATLDTFRVEPDGTTVMAGRAVPLAVIDILSNGKYVGQVTADATGSFVAFLDLGYAEMSRAISLTSDAQVTFDETYLIAPLPKPDVAVAEQTQIPAAPAVIVASTAGVRVAPSGVINPAPQVLTSIALDSITYDPDGDVLIAGRATGSGQVQIYIDNQPVTMSRIAADGDWRVGLPDVDIGIYTLRIDELGDAGRVVSRIETPFLREDPDVVAQALATQTQDSAFQVAMTTVQPGTTLWAIAQERFGDGILYVKVFEANRDRIRDPDLIYPGQVFRMPQADR